MAINLDERYPGRANPKTLDYPQGSFKNRSSPTAKDGTYLEQDWANDLLAFFQSMLQEANITANGQVDTAQASQYYDALIQNIRSQEASESEKGVLEIATNSEAQELTRDDRALTPKKLAAALQSFVPGVGQTWQDLAGSRAPSTVYTNTTGRVISVSVSCADKSSGAVQGYVNSLMVAIIDVQSSTTVSNPVSSQIFLLVPPEGTYEIRFTGDPGSQEIRAWAELR